MVLADRTRSGTAVLEMAGEETCQTLVEYALSITFIAAVALAAVVLPRLSTRSN